MKLFSLTPEGKIQLHESVTPLQTVRELHSLKYNAGKEWEDSDGRDRKRFNAELFYVYYYYSRTSPYKAYNDIDRLVKAKLEANLPKSWRESAELKKFIELVRELEDNTDTKKALRAVRGMLQNLIKHIEGVDFDAETDKGVSKYDVNKYVVMASKVSELLDKLKELEEKADAEDNLQGSRIWGGGKKGNREDRKQHRESTV